MAGSGSRCLSSGFELCAHHSRTMCLICTCIELRVALRVVLHGPLCCVARSCCVALSRLASSEVSTSMCHCMTYYIVSCLGVLDCR